MRVLVTGGNGFIGSTVVRMLCEKGYTVRCTLRQSSDTSRLQGLPYETTMADIRDAQSLRSAVEGCDAVIHCASLSNWKDLGSPELDSIVVGGTRNLIDIMEEKSIRMIYLSSAAALGASPSAKEIRSADSAFNLDPKKYRYAACKAEAERHCLEAVKHGADIVIVNPTETYGPGDTAGITASTLIEFTAGPVCLICDGGTSVAHVEDVANGIIAALEKGRSGRRYVLGGENVSIAEMAAIAQRCAGTRYPIIRVPSFLLKAFVAVAGAMKIPVLQPVLTKYRYATHYWFFDNAQTTHDLGIRFRSAEETIADTLAWLKESRDAKK